MSEPFIQPRPDSFLGRMWNLIVEDSEHARLAADPDGYAIEATGGLDAHEVAEALELVADTLPPEPAVQLADALARAGDGDGVDAIVAQLREVADVSLPEPDVDVGTDPADLDELSDAAAFAAPGPDAPGSLEADAATDDADPPELVDSAVDSTGLPEHRPDLPEPADDGGADLQPSQSDPGQLSADPADPTDDDELESMEPAIPDVDQVGMDEIAADEAGDLDVPDA